VAAKTDRPGPRAVWRLTVFDPSAGCRRLPHVTPAGAGPHHAILGFIKGAGRRGVDIVGVERVWIGEVSPENHQEFVRAAGGAPAPVRD